MTYDITSFCRFFLSRRFFFNPFGAVYQGSYSIELFIFLDFFPWPFQVSKALGLAVTLKNFQSFPCFGVFLTFKSSTATNSEVHQNVSRLRC